MMSNEFQQKLFADQILNIQTMNSVVIPVRNEAENIERTLDAFVRQVDLDGGKSDSNKFEILVLVNNCTDNSAQIVKNFQAANPQVNLHLAEIFLPEENANIGFVRRVLMDTAFQRLKSSNAGIGVIMTTDGDTIVAVNIETARKFGNRKLLVFKEQFNLFTIGNG